MGYLFKLFLPKRLDKETNQENSLIDLNKILI